MARLLVLVETPDNEPLTPAVVALHLNLGAGCDPHAPGYTLRTPTAVEVGGLADGVTFAFSGDPPHAAKRCVFLFDTAEAAGTVTLTSSGAYGVDFALDKRALGVFDLFPATAGKPNAVCFDSPTADELAARVVPTPDGCLWVTVNVETAEGLLTDTGPGAIRGDGRDSQFRFDPPTHPEAA